MRWLSHTRVPIAIAHPCTYPTSNHLLLEMIVDVLTVNEQQGPCNAGATGGVEEEQVPCNPGGAVTDAGTDSLTDSPCLNLA